MPDFAGDACYYCLFCLSKGEAKVIRELGEKQPEIQAVVAVQEKWKKENGKKVIVREALLPGYVFLCANGDFLNLSKMFSVPGVLRVLGDAEREYQLHGSDREFAQWIFQSGGLIGVSKVYSEGDWIHVTEGPLLNCAGNIERVNKRACVAQVRLNFDNNSFSVWLPFDWIDKKTT